MEFIFFSAADAVLFSRGDAESATWTVEEMSLQALFPYDAARVIQRGMRVGFVDETGVMQPFEIRKVRTYEPDHYQEITAEHIAVAELTDDHMQQSELTDVTPQAALSGLLGGTLWSVGNVTASNLSSGNLARGSVWQGVRTIEENWNVYITPRVTFNTRGITGRYLDIAPAAGVWRGVRLSLDKNADEMGVTWDDSNLATALYGYGGLVEKEGSEGEEDENEPLTFADVVWEQTADHPAKPQGQTYIEDAQATANYGRNGRPRFGFYQNASIKDPEILLQKTWESLKLTLQPSVTVDCLVRDLYRLGYADQPIRLHDTAMIEERQTGERLQLTIIKLMVDLLDPTATRPTIGTYIPNIIYINRETAEKSGGGGGGRGLTNIQNELTEFDTEITQSKTEINLRAYQHDMNNVENILRQAGMRIDASGVLIYADDNVNMIGSKFKVEADKITSLQGHYEEIDGQVKFIADTGVIQNSEHITQVAGKFTVDSEGNVQLKDGAQLSVRKDGIYQTVGTVDEIDAVGSRITTIEGSALWVKRDNITGVVGKMYVDNEGNIHVLNGSGLYLDEGTASLGVYTSGNLTAGIIVEKINGGQVTIQASKIDLQGYVTANQLEALEADFQSLTTGATTASVLQTRVLAVDNYIYMSDGQVYRPHFVSMTGAGTGATGKVLGNADIELAHYHAITASESNGVITITQGAVQTEPGTATFNIADTQFYKDAVESAYQRGAAAGSRSVSGLEKIVLGSGDIGTNVRIRDVDVFYDNDDEGSVDVLVDASAVYSAGRNDVTINKGSWSGGNIAFTKSAGTASTKTVALAQGSASWRSGNYANIVDVPVLDGGVQTGLTVTVNAVSRYNAGYTQGSADGWEIGNQQGVANGTNAAKAADIVVTTDGTIAYDGSVSPKVLKVPLTAKANLDRAYDYAKTVDVDCTLAFDAGKNSVTARTMDVTNIVEKYDRFTVTAYVSLSNGKYVQVTGEMYK